MREHFREHIAEILEKRVQKVVKRTGASAAELHGVAFRALVAVYGPVTAAQIMKESAEFLLEQARRDGAI